MTYPGALGYTRNMERTTEIKKGKTYRVTGGLGNATFTVEGFETLDWGPGDTRTGTPGVYGIRHDEDSKGTFSYESWERTSDLGTETKEAGK